MTKMLGRKCVAELVEVEALAVQAFCAPVTMFGYTLPAIEFCSMRDPFYHFDVETVRLSLGVRKDQFRRRRIAPSFCFSN